MVQQNSIENSKEHKPIIARLFGNPPVIRRIPPTHSLDTSDPSIINTQLAVY